MLNTVSPSTTITAQWHPGPQRRCADKRRHSGLYATRLAERQTARAGALIIAYKCVDCGYWHIGHADRSQFKV
jgi:hypothetical protein